MRPIRVLLAVSAVALVAAACGDDSTPAASGGSSAPAASASASAGSSSGDVSALPAAEIVSRAKDAFKKATSVHVTGGGTSGQQTFKVDMRYTADGKAIGTVDNGGQTVEIRRLGQTIYVKASPAFWSAAGGAKAGTLFGNKYVKAPVNDQRVAPIVSLTDKGSFIDSALATTGTVTKGATKTINGTPAVALTIKDSSGGSTLYVASTGEPLPVEALPEVGGTDTGKIDFVEYGATVDVALPPAAQTVDVSALPAN
ncbi:MAG TPA: hypothetical protein VGP36_12055 [Mycobacteriales bacterium]|nr:hypothetical protein [Mycobacteriales bacterium]